ncbi:MAG: DNA gyrase inhibitor YacG [Comamonas sp.]|uniref:DNA gyrase inhibitor YacG n=1 Tax=Comamonas sp. TaxID=34028 RepID=UPI002FC63859
MSDNTSHAPTVQCPTCGGPSVFEPANAWRPFCSQRCKNIDLGAWAAEEFRMPVQTPPQEAQYGDPRTED